MEERTQDVLDVLSIVHIFDTLNEQQLETVAENADTYLFSEDEVIFKQGDDAEGFYIILSGRVSIQRGFDEEAEEISIFQRGDYFGEEGLVIGQDRRVNAVALTNVSVLRFSSEQIDHLANLFPQIVKPIRLTLDSYQLFLTKNFGWRAPREAVEFISRKHRFFLFVRLIAPTLVGMASIIPIAILYFGASNQNPVVLVLLLLNILFILGWYAWNVIDWANDYAIITNRRVVSLEKIFLLYESRQEAPLDAVLSVETKTSQLGRIVGYGDVVMRTYTGILTFSRLKNPELVVRMINEERQRATSRSKKAQRFAKEDLIRSRIGVEKREEDPFFEKLTGEQPIQEETPRKLTSGKLGYWLSTFFHLREEEKGVITYRTHWFILLRRVSSPTLALFFWAVFFILSLFDVLTIFPLESTLWLYLLSGSILLGWWVYQYVDWRNDRYIIGHEQLVDVYKKPLGQEQKRSAPIKNIQTVEFERLGLIRLILNFGTVFIRVGDTQLSFNDVYNPSDIQREIFERYQEYNQSQKEKERENLRQEMADWIEIYHQVVQNGGTPPPPPTGDSISGYNIGEY